MHPNYFIAHSTPFKRKHFIALHTHTALGCKKIEEDVRVRLTDRKGIDKLNCGRIAAQFNKKANTSQKFESNPLVLTKSRHGGVPYSQI
jgi:hypothetical protein